MQKELDLAAVAGEFTEINSMAELLEAIYTAGEYWRAEHTTIKTKKTGEEVANVAMPSALEVAKELSRLVVFSFIGNGGSTDKSPLYIYDLDKGVYVTSDDLLNLFCSKFDSRMPPRQWGSVKLAVRTLTKMRRPLESPNHIPVANGIVDLRSKELLPFSPSWVTTSKIATSYRRPSDTPLDREGNTFDNWLESIAAGDPELVILFWQIILEAINPNHTREKMAIFYGSGANGKGTFQQFLINLIGADNVAALKPAQFSERHDLEMLVGRVCNIGDDIPNEHLKNTANLMSVVSGDTVSINPKGSKGFEASLKLFNIFSGNYIPSSGNKSAGWYRRLLLVPFKADFSGQDKKPWIKDEFLADKAVLEYALYQAINQPQFTQFIEPQATKDLLAEYQEDNDYLLSWIKSEYVAKGWHELAVVPVWWMNRSLKNFAEDMGIQKPKIYGASRDTIRHLHDLTKNRYTLGNGRVKAEEVAALDPDGFEHDKLTAVSKAIKRE